jgi:D-aspartate ligase
VNTSVPAVVLKMFHGGLGVARSLGRLGVPVYGVHDDAQAPGARSRYLREVWKLDLDATPAAEAVAFLLERADGLDRPILFATDDSGGLFVAENAAALEAGFRIAVPPVEVVRSLASKQGLTRVCAEHGITTPATAFPRSRGSATAASSTSAIASTGATAPTSCSTRIRGSA